MSFRKRQSNGKISFLKVRDILHWNRTGRRRQLIQNCRCFEPESYIRNTLMKVKLMTVIQYYRDGRPNTSKEFKNPSWDLVEKSIKQMDNYCFPIVWLHPSEDPDDEKTLDIIGGNGRWAVLHHMGDWQHSDGSGDETEARLWESDQGYECQEQNVIKDIETVLKYVRVFYDTASYAKLKQVNTQIKTKKSTKKKK